MPTAGALRASRCLRTQAPGSGRGRAARVVECRLRIDGADPARRTAITAEARGRRRSDPRDRRWAGDARCEQAQQTVHVGAALDEVALVIVRGLRNARKQYGKRQEQDDAAAPSRLLEQPNRERTTGSRFPRARDATRERQPMARQGHDSRQQPREGSTRQAPLGDRYCQAPPITQRDAKSLLHLAAALAALPTARRPPKGIQMLRA